MKACRCAAATGSSVGEAGAGVESLPPPPFFFFVLLFLPPPVAAAPAPLPAAAFLGGMAGRRGLCLMCKMGRAWVSRSRFESFNKDANRSSWGV